MILETILFSVNSIKGIESRKATKDNMLYKIILPMATNRMNKIHPISIKYGVAKSNSNQSKYPARELNIIVPRH